jgi:hypothetical protein
MARLHMMERNSIVGLLLTDAVWRLHLLATDAGGRWQYDNNDEIQKKKDLVTLARRMVQCLSMEVGDSTTTLLIRHKLSSSPTRIITNTTVMDSSLLQHRPPDICYLHPMFPPRKKNKWPCCMCYYWWWWLWWWGSSSRWRMWYQQQWWWKKEE